MFKGIFKTITLLSLALCFGMAAQAQNTFVVTEMVTQPKDAVRAGGENEAAGSIWLTFSTQAALATTTITVNYSVPLAMDITETNNDDYTSVNVNLVGTAEHDDNDGNGTLVIDTITATSTLVIRNVPLDVSDASGPVTVMVEIESSDATDFLRFDGPNSGMVASDTVVGVEAEADAGIVRTRGTDSGGVTAELTLEEAFSDAFMMGNMLDIEFSGIPDDTTLTAEVTSNPMLAENAVDGDYSSESYATVGAVSSMGVATVTLGGMDMRDDPNAMRPTPDEVTIMLTLVAASNNDDITFPLDVGSVMAKVTFADDGTNGFEDAFTDYVTVFMIRPAQCEMLFPVVTRLAPWETAISITNPAYEDEMASGGLTFTFYPMGAEPVMY